MCNYARSNGVYDLATKIGCPTCPCGHGFIDKHLDKLCHKDIDISKLVQHSKIKNPPHSKKDRAKLAHPIVKKMNFIMVEYSTFKSCGPFPGQFVYITLLRHPVDQLISWSTRFEGVKVNRAWHKAVRSFEKGDVDSFRKFFRRRDSRAESHGAFYPHKVHSISNTFGAVSTSTEKDRFEKTIRELLKFNFVWLHENIYDEIDSTAVKYLEWKNGKSYLEKLGKGNGQYVKSQGRQSLSESLVKFLENYLSVDISVYEKMRAFNEEREELRRICKKIREDH